MIKKLFPVITLFAGVIAGYLVGVQRSGEDGKNVCPIPAKSAVSEKSSLEVAATPIMKNIVSSFKSADYQAYKKDYIPDLAKDEKSFKEFCGVFKNLAGENPSAQWIGSYNKGGTFVTLWKISGNDGDLLITMSLLKRENKYFVVGFFTS